MNRFKDVLLILVILIINISCTNRSEIIGDVNSIERDLSNRDDLIFYGSFDEGFNDEKWNARWGIEYIEFGSRPQIIPNAHQNTKSLRVKYKKGGIGPEETGVSFPIVFNNFQNTLQSYYDSLYLRYYVKFEEGFDFRLGGKLPGMMGGGNSWTRSGGNQPDGTNGWTLRFMWREKGRLVIYAYLPKSGNGKYGGREWGQDLDCEFTAITGNWHCIEQYIKIGAPGKDDGKLVVWIDGEEKLSLTDLRFWDVENDYGKIGGIYFSTFHGGNTPDWAPLNDSYIQFDGIVASTNRIGL